MKELIGKVTLKSSNLPQKITVNKVDLLDQKKIAHEFNFFFTNMETKPLSINELKHAFYSLKSDKSRGYDNISYNIT